MGKYAAQTTVSSDKIERHIALLSWVAGIVEGEGTITITRSGIRGYTRPQVSITSTDPDILAPIQDRWPGALSTRQPPGRAKLAHTWTLNVRSSIARFLFDILPFLHTDRVRRKALLVLQDVGARVQGARGEDYMRQCHERREQIRALNKRGQD